MTTRLWQIDPMYNPAPFPEDRIGVLHAFIRQHPLAALVSCGSNGLEATHVPMVLHPELGPAGVLRCHVARGNVQWRTLQESSQVLAIFLGPQHYITPSWYAAKEEHGKVVPTWNYAAVHVRGRAKLIEGCGELIQHLRTLTDENERAYEKPWSVDDAPKEYIEALSKAIVGIEIAIDVIEGKWKASQNRSESDIRGVVVGLSAMNSPESLEMAQIVKERGLK